MKPISYARPTQVSDAVKMAARVRKSRFLAGGTNLIDLAKLNVETPETLLDVSGLPLTKVEVVGNRLRLGALARNSDVAWNPEVKKRYPALSEALLAGASPQLRNLATVGGNLLQRTRCPYFNDVAFSCNRREPGSGCSAIHGYNRSHAVLGTSEHCIATNPSDMCVALAALSPVVRVQGEGGIREIPFEEFHRLPGATPHLETTLKPGELILSVDVPELPSGARSKYVKVRDRASYDFALASAAVVLVLDGSAIRDVRVALGGVATKPWRAREAENGLIGKSLDEYSFRMAAEAALRAAKPALHNGFKVVLAQNVIGRALKEAGGMKL